MLKNKAQITDVPRYREPGTENWELIHLHKSVPVASSQLLREFSRTPGQPLNALGDRRVSGE